MNGGQTCTPSCSVLRASSTVETNRKDTQQKAGSKAGRGDKQNKNKKNGKQRKEEKNNDANKKQQQKWREKPSKSAETQTTQCTDCTEENTTIQLNKKRDGEETKTHLHTENGNKASIIGGGGHGGVQKHHRRTIPYMTRTQAAGAPHTEAKHETKDEKEPYRHTPRQCDRRTDKKKKKPGWRQQSSSKATGKKQRVTEDG